MQEGFAKKKGQVRQEQAERKSQAEPSQGEALIMGFSRKLSRAGAIALAGMLASATPALAESASLQLGSTATSGGIAPALRESHPLQSSFGSFSDPNGIAVDEATGDVYVADIGTDAIYKFDQSGNPVSFPSLAGNELTGAATPQKAFSFPSEGNTPAAIAVDDACTQQTPALTGEACAKYDPSAGDLYVMDATDKVVDKFNSNGEYLDQISSPLEGAPLLGLGVDGKGDLRVHTYPRFGVNILKESNEKKEIEVFDNAVDNVFVVSLHSVNGSEVPGSVFAVAPSGDMYAFETECGCMRKDGGYMEPLGLVDNGPGDVAAAVDPLTGHVYVDEQASVAEWDTGAMNGEALEGVGFSTKIVGSGAPASAFGSTQLEGNSSGQGGIAVNGRAGAIYVSSPADGKVYVFGTNTPGVSAGAANGVTKTAATLNGTVDPRGEGVASCRFEYEAVKYTSFFGSQSLMNPVAGYHHTVPCKQTPAEIGSGAAPVPVSAEVSGLQAGQLYDFRLVGENAGGAAFADGRFASEAPGFGIKGFDVSFLNEDGTPDTQAGSHPHEMLTSISLNTQIVPREKEADSRYETLPDGNVKDIVTDLPAGLVGDPNATEKKCTLAELDAEKCPEESRVGELEIVIGELTYAKTFSALVYNMVPPRGVAVQLGVNFLIPNAFIDVGVRAGGDYPVRAIAPNITQVASTMGTRLKVFGVVGSGEHRKPFLTLPTGCAGPLKSTVSADSYQDPGHFAEATSLTHESAGQPVLLTGCEKLKFPATITVAPDTANASTASGLTVGVHVPQKSAFNPEGLAESALRDTTVTLPEGVTINPSGANGLEACSEGLAGFSGFNEFNPEYEPGVQTATFTPELPSPLAPGANFCPDGAKIGTVQIKTPLLSHPLEGAVYLATQNSNPFGSLVAMYLIAEDPASGTLIKLAGEVSLTDTGQIVTTFKNTPDLPFEDLELHFFGGERAPLSTPSRCGTYTTQAVFTPWDGNPPVHTNSTFQIEHGPGGGPCPGQSLPFAPSLTAGATNVQAGAFSPFTMTMSRPDGSQSLDAIALHMPPGLSGTLTGVELCPEPQADEGLCGPGSLIGETTISVGVGSDPFTVTGGKVYLTGPYRGAPFGLSIVNPAKAGPFDLENTPTRHPACDCLVVRAKIDVDPTTAALTVTSDTSGPYSIPTMIEGIPLQIQHVNVTIGRPGFTFNPTSCAPMAITGELTSTEGATDALSLPFQVTNCARLAFKPRFKVSTQGGTSRRNGASLHVKLTYPNAPQGTQANIHSVHVELPRALPSRLTTLNHACADSAFDRNPSGCPSQSRVGFAKAVTPVLPVPLEGPAYFVSHGGQRFPELIVVLQGYGVTVYLHGETFISKTGITSSTFKTVPDIPIGTFELTLPEGEYSALAANTNLCSASLVMPTTFTAQNGAVLAEKTPIEAQGCAYNLQIRAHRVHNHTLTLRVAVPGAGMLTAHGKGLRGRSRTSSRRSTLTLKLPESRAGRLSTKVLVSFTPRAGKQRRILRKSLTVRFP
jgi:hypothetical protein